MLVNVVTVHVKAERVQDFIAATLENHRGSRAEPGNCRFDVIQGNDDPTRFVLYEVFDSMEAVEIHRKTLHCLAWKEQVEPWMAKPRESQWHTVIAPAVRAAW